MSSESSMTTELRMMMTRAINSKESSREELEEAYGDVWDTQQVEQEFVIHGFLAPFVKATRKSDNKEGLLVFQHSPRFYFMFDADDEE